MAKVEHLWQYETSPEFTDGERAALRLAQAAGQVPNAVTDAHFVELRRHFSDDQIVEIVALIAFFGFLNRWNDTFATPLEAGPREFAERHLAASGWTVGKHAGAIAATPPAHPAAPLKVRLLLWILKHWGMKPRRR